jgi:putative transposase
MEEYKRGSHTVWDCKYHLVWVTKYRHELLRETAAAHEVVIHAGSVEVAIPGTSACMGCGDC